MTTFYRAPVVSVVGRPQFIEPQHIAINWNGTRTDGEALIELAGRNCYQSFHNPAGRTTAEYITNILEHQHGSVFEHAVYSLLLEGVSRSLTHELIRHRAGTAMSELSQRFVDADRINFVYHPSILGDTELEQQFEETCRDALLDYDFVEQKLMLKFFETIPNTTLRLKRAREAAREFLPSGAETKIVFTGNARAWRHILAMRGSIQADAQIYRLALAIHEALAFEAPLLFGDFELDAEGSLVPKYTKV